MIIDLKQFIERYIANIALQGDGWCPSEIIAYDGQLTSKPSALMFKQKHCIVDNDKLYQMKNHENSRIFRENQSETVKHKNAQEKPWHQKTLSMINDGWVQIIAFIVAILNVCPEKICNSSLWKKDYRYRIATEIWPPKSLCWPPTASLNKKWTFLSTRPKPPYGRQGPVGVAGINKNVTHAGSQLTF